MSLTSYDSVPFGIKQLGSTYLTELARELQQIQPDPLAPFFPTRMTPVKTIKVEQVETNLRVTGVVGANMPNGLNTFNKARTQSYEAANFRRGQFIDMETINYLRKEGTDDQTYGMDLVQEQVRELVDQCNHMMSVLRAQMLSGGINYVDPENGMSVVAASGIPSTNLYTIGTSAPTASSAHWHDVTNAKPVTDIQNIMFRATLEGKARPTHMAMNGQLLHLLSMNKEVRSYMHPNAQSALLTGAPSIVTWGADGMPTAIAGVTIVRCDTLYDDKNATTGVLERKYMWPINKVALFAANNPQLPGEVLGHTWWTRGEHPTGGMGIWVRTWDHNQMGGPTTAPGVGMQVGAAGLPVLRKPTWVHLITAATQSEITTATGSTKYIV